MPEYAAAEAQILEQIPSPVDRAAFNFFYNATQKEGIDTPPGYTWDQFENGVAAFNQRPIEEADGIVVASGLVPNYTPETTTAHGLVDAVPLTEALTGPFVRAIHRKRQEGAVRILGIHPSIASPFVIARSLAAAYQETFAEDIRDSIYIVVGAYPTVMKYDIRLSGGNRLPISPVDFGRYLGHLVLTAPKTASTETDEGAVQEWMDAARATFKVRNREILAGRGNVMIVHPSGRRGRRSTAKVPPFQHVEYLPDSSLKYITDIDVPTFVVGNDDNLLNDARQPASEVFLHGDPRPWYLRKDEQVTQALRRSALLASHGDTLYRVEGWRDRAMRLGRKAIGRHNEDSLE